MTARMLTADLLGSVCICINSSLSLHLGATPFLLLRSRPQHLYAHRWLSHMQLCSQCTHVLGLHRCAAPVQDPPVLEYLREASRSTYDITLKVSIQPEGSPEPSVITHSNLKHL